MDKLEYVLVIVLLFLQDHKSGLVYGVWKTICQTFVIV